MPPELILKLQRGADHLHALGPRALSGFLEDLATRTHAMPEIVTLLTEYRARLTPELIRVACGDRFPPRIARVPHDAAA